MTYALTRVQSRFCPLKGYLYFYQNFVLTSNIDRQTSYILMLYLNNMISDNENGFLELKFSRLYSANFEKRHPIFVYQRQGHFLVLLLEEEFIEKFPKEEVKIFLDKNLSFKMQDGESDLAKDSVHYFVCNDSNGLSKENMFQYRYI